MFNASILKDHGYIFEMLQKYLIEKETKLSISNMTRKGINYQRNEQLPSRALSKLTPQEFRFLKSTIQMKAILFEATEANYKKEVFSVGKYTAIIQECNKYPALNNIKNKLITPTTTTVSYRDTHYDINRFYNVSCRYIKALTTRYRAENMDPNTSYSNLLVADTIWRMEHANVLKELLWFVQAICTPRDFFKPTFKLDRTYIFNRWLSHTNHIVDELIFNPETGQFHYGFGVNSTPITAPEIMYIDRVKHDLGSDTLSTMREPLMKNVYANGYYHSQRPMTKDEIDFEFRNKKEQLGFSLYKEYSASGQGVIISGLGCWWSDGGAGGGGENRALRTLIAAIKLYEKSYNYDFKLSDILIHKFSHVNSPEQVILSCTNPDIAADFVQKILPRPIWEDFMKISQNNPFTPAGLVQSIQNKEISTNIYKQVSSFWHKSAQLENADCQPYEIGVKVQFRNFIKQTEITAEVIADYSNGSFVCSENAIDTPALETFEREINTPDVMDAIEKERQFIPEAIVTQLGELLEKNTLAEMDIKYKFNFLRLFQVIIKSHLSYKDQNGLNLTLTQETGSQCTMTNPILFWNKSAATGMAVELNKESPQFNR